VDLEKQSLFLPLVKHVKYKQIKRYVTANDSNEFAKIVDSYNRLCDSIHKKCNEFRKKEYLYWIKIGCSLALKKDSREIYTYLPRLV